MKRAAIAAAALALALTGCSAADPEPTADGTVSQDTFLTTHGLAAMDAVEIIDHLDRQKVTERPTDLIASVRADELLLSSDDQEVVVDLPDNQTYVSIAPYLTSTHDCFYHSLTTCRGNSTMRTSRSRSPMRRPVRCWWTRRQPPSTMGLLASGFLMMPPS